MNTEVLLLRCGTFVSGLVPRALARWVALGLADAARILIPSLRRAVVLNLSHIAGNRTPAERRRLCRSTFRNYGRCMMDILNLPHLRKKELFQLVQPFGVEYLERVLVRGKGVILLMPHLGNWDLGGVVLAALDFPMNVIVEYISPEINAQYDRYRGVMGGRSILLGAAGRSSLKVLRRGEVLLLLADRAFGSHAISVEFAGGWQALPKGPARLALATGATLLVGYGVLTADSRERPYKLVIEEEISVSGLGDDAVAELTARIAQRLGSVVSRYPDQWFVFQPEWRDPP